MKRDQTQLHFQINKEIVECHDY